MKNILSKLPEGLVYKINSQNLNEISLRAGKNVVLKSGNIFYPVDYKTTQNEIEEILKRFCNMSLYAYLDEISNGFITVVGGHRIGICGTAVLKNSQIYNIKDVTSVNIRIAHEVIGCAEKVNFNVRNLLVISPPCCGKTTLIRDLCRIIGKKNKICIVDERGEIAGIGGKNRSFDVGDMTDVLSMVPKSIGIEYVLRSMSPEYIVTDEISSSDSEFLDKAFTYGVKIIATAHGENINKTLRRLKLSEKGKEFNNIIRLGNSNGIGTVEEVLFND